jgi:hypothetical protein
VGTSCSKREGQRKSGFRADPCCQTSARPLRAAALTASPTTVSPRGALDELLPAIPAQALVRRSTALREALGAQILGIARCHPATLPAGSSPVFRILSVVDRGGSVVEQDTALPLPGFRQLLAQGCPLAVGASSAGQLGEWLRRRGGGKLVGWPLPGDRLPCVAFLAHVGETWQPGALRMRVARRGMEALALSLSPPVWLLRSGFAHEAGAVGADASYVAGGALASRTTPPLDTLKEPLQIELIRRALREARGNKSQAARTLHLSRSALYRKLARLRLLEKEGGST